uniref:Transmembrane protein 41B n=1 Tax=Steinernema glaseri TaxID=37863 RepID=A0A1I7ZNZ3_9BILA
MVTPYLVYVDHAVVHGQLTQWYHQRMGVLTTRQGITLFSVIAVYMTLLGAVYRQFPEMSPEEREHFKLPMNLDDAKNLGKVLLRYREDHYYTVMIGLTSVYLMLQSFAIPGSIFLTILSGYLFNLRVALFLVCMCSACGATVCYFLSLCMGRRILERFFPEKLAYCQKMVEDNRKHLLYYILFLRITPTLPNWLINIVSPILDVPLTAFFLGTFVGVAPPSLFYLTAGQTLEQMTSTSGIVWNWHSLLLMGFATALAVAPIVYDKIFNKKKSE